jgi:hypothetical protein
MSKADIYSAKRHIRFNPESGHVRCNYGGPLWANSAQNALQTTRHEYRLAFA